MRARGYRSEFARAHAEIADWTVTHALRAYVRDSLCDNVSLLSDMRHVMRRGCLFVCQLRARTVCCAQFNAVSDSVTPSDMRTRGYRQTVSDSSVDLRMPVTRRTGYARGWIYDAICVELCGVVACRACSLSVVASVVCASLRAPTRVRQTAASDVGPVRRMPNCRQFVTVRMDMLGKLRRRCEIRSVYRFGGYVWQMRGACLLRLWTACWSCRICTDDDVRLRVAVGTCCATRAADHADMRMICVRCARAHARADSSMRARCAYGLRGSPDTDMRMGAQVYVEFVCM